MKQALSSTLSTPLSKQSKQVNGGERENNNDTLNCPDGEVLGIKYFIHYNTFFGFSLSRSHNIHRV